MAAADKQAVLRGMGAHPIDYTRGDLVTRVHEVAPDGVAAVFDHRGGPALRESWEMLAPGGTLIAYGVANYRDATGDPMIPVYDSLNILEELGKTDPSRHTAFFNVWEGKDRNLEKFREALRDNLENVFGMVAAGQLQPAIAATYPLAQAADALRYAESGQAVGKVILVP